MDIPTTSSVGSHNSGSDYSSSSQQYKKGDAPLPPPVLVYHESARSIVFRDHIRRANNKKNDGDTTNSKKTKDIISSANSSDVNIPIMEEEPYNAETIFATDDAQTNASVTSSVAVDSQHNHHNGSGNKSNTPSQVIITNDGKNVPVIEPLEALEVMPMDEFASLLQSQAFTLESSSLQNTDNMSVAEKEVMTYLQQERAVVKTVRNHDWTAFLQKILNATNCPFLTSTTLLPPNGVKMRCFGSTREYTVGVIFALPHFHTEKDEDDELKRTKTWSWPSGYSAKTEFNIDQRGNLINGREEALVSIPNLRKQNHDYCHKKDYEICGRLVKGGLKTVPYNEVYVRVGGVGRIVNGINVATQQEAKRSYDGGIGLPIALFVRSASYKDLIAMLRTRARMVSILGRQHIHGIPLLFIDPDSGTRVLTDSLQKELLHIMASSLNPFQNPLLEHYTNSMSNNQDLNGGNLSHNHNTPQHLQQKLEELIDLDDDDIRQTLTHEECARLAGGFGATDDSLANLLLSVMLSDKDDTNNEESSPSGTNHDTPQQNGKLQDLVNEGLTSAVRSGDYNTARQLLILYTLVASKKNQQQQQQQQIKDNCDHKKEDKKLSLQQQQKKLTKTYKEESSLAKRKDNDNFDTLASKVPPPPPPPPLDTDRLRSATNSDGLLSVLGAAEVLKSIQDGSGKKRVEEAVSAIEEWIENGEHSVAFRLASWFDQRAAQGDLKIATEHDTSFMAFVSNKAISNRKNFAKQLRHSITDVEDLSFLKVIHDMVTKMHSPCLRLELLQYILGLDNRYSVAHVARSVELAATCLNISAHDASHQNDDDNSLLP